ncbi:type II secretion system protein, partial [Vibrio sp. 10N.261.48.A2]
MWSIKSVWLSKIVSLAKSKSLSKSMSANKHTPRKQGISSKGRGFTLIEVLVSIA